MRSGKPPAPWRRDRRRRGPRVAVIAVLVVLFAAIGAYLLWRARPQPLPWHPVGAERIVTPAFDIADERQRMALNLLADESRLNNRGRAWLGARCGSLVGDGAERYVMTRAYGGMSVPIGGYWRIVVTLDRGGQVDLETFNRGYDGTVIDRHSRMLDEEEAERFRSLVIDGGYPQMAPFSGNATDANAYTLESCIDGRYYGVYEAGGDNGPRLSALASQVEAFAREEIDTRASPR